MNITLRLFASVRESVGTSQELLTLPPHITTVGALRHFLRERGGAWESALAENRALRMACDQVMCSVDTPLKDNSEVAFFPPVTGG